MTPTSLAPVTNAPRKKRRVVRRKTVAARPRPTPPDDTPQKPPLTAKQALENLRNDPNYRPKSGAELVAVFKDYVYTDVDQRVHDRIQKSRALDKQRALAEGLPWD